MNNGFALALVLSLAAAQGGHAQQVVAQLSARLGRSTGLLFVAAGASALTAGVMAMLGASLQASVPVAMRAPLACAVLLAAAIVLTLPLRTKPLVEPTRSHGAIGIALLMRQSIDAPRICVLALAIISGTSWPIAIDGALGSSLALAMGWALADRLDCGRRLWLIRLMAGVMLAMLAIFIGLAG